MASDYLEQSQSANKSMGKKAKAVRRQQRRAANEAVAFVTSGPKETRGKYQELGVSGFKVIAGAFARVASNAAKSGNVAAFEEAMSLSRAAGLAARFPKSPGAAKIVNTLKQSAIKYKSEGGGSGVPRSVLNRTEYQIPREESIVIARGAAKVIGKTAGGDPGVIGLGKEFSNIAKQPKTPYFNKETNRFVNPEAGPYQVRASSTGKLDLKDNVIRGYPVGGPNAERISRLNRQSQEEIIRRNIQRDIANKQKGMKRGR